MNLKKITLAVVAGTTLLAAAPAFADWGHGYGGRAPYYRPAYAYAPRPVYFAPRPVYYARRPVYYAPRPAYYAPRPMIYGTFPISPNFGFSFGFGL